MPLTVFTRINFVADFLQAKCDFRGKTAVFRFWAPFGGLIRATYGDHLRLIGKRVDDFLLVLIELFSLGRTAEALRAIICSKSAISANGGRLTLNFRSPSTNHSASQETRLNVLSYGIKITTDFSSFCQNARVWRTDGQNSHRKTVSAFHAAR